MNAVDILLLIGTMYALLMGLVILFRDIKNPVNLAFAILSFLIAFTTYINYHMNNAESAQEVYALLRVISLRMVIFPVSVHFYLLLTRQNHILKVFWIYPLLYLFPAVSIFTTDPEGLFYLHFLGEEVGWNFSLKPTPLGMAMSLFIVLMILITMILAVMHVVRSRPGRNRAQAVFVLTGFAIALLIPVLTDILFPANTQNLPQTGTFTFIIGFTLIGYGIIRYELFAATPETAADEVMKTVTDAVLLTDASGKIEFANPSAIRMTAYSSAGITSMNVNQLFVKEVTKGGGMLSDNFRENTLISARGRNIPVVLSHAPLTRRSGHILGYAFILHEITELRNLLDRVRESEKKYRTVTENSLDIVSRHNEAGEFVYISPAISALGYPAEYLIGKTPVEILHPSDIERVSKIILETQEEMTNFLVEYRLRHVDGHFIWSETRGIWILDGDERSLICHTRDISARKQIESLLSESEERYRLLFDKSPDGILLMKDLYTHISANQSALRILGLHHQEELTHTSFFSLVIPEDQVRLNLNEQKRNEGLDFVGLLEIRIKRRDGEIRSLELMAHEMLISGEKYIQIILRDITERVESQIRLSESEQRYSLLVESSPDDIFLVDREMKFLMMNAHAAASLGIEAAAAEGLGVKDVFPEEIASRQAASIRRVFETGMMSQHIKTFTMTRMGIRWYTTILIPVRNSEGRVSSVMGIARDITEAEEAEIKIRENEEKYRLFLENFQGIALRMDLNDKPEFLYGDVQGITGYTIDNFLNGTPKVLKLIYEEDRVQLLKSLKMLRLIPHSKTTSECRIYHRDGSLRYLRVFLQNQTDNNGNPSHILGAIFDKTDQYELQNRIINAIIETEDKERSRFAEDLHDELGPLLSSVRMYVNLIEIKTPGLAGEVKDLILFAKQLLDDAVQQTKNIAYNIMPEILGEYGLIPSIKTYCSQVNKSNLVKISIITDLEDEKERFDQKVELALYRVIKELIYNTVQHSRARSISIRFWKAGGMPAVEYSDDGDGFNLEDKLKKGKSLGVRNIFHRIESLNGVLHFFTAPGKGVRVQIRW